MDATERLLAAAAHVYAEAGFRGSTTKRIAETAGLNEITIFRLFGSKDALIARALGRHCPAGSTARLPDVPVDPEREVARWCTMQLETMRHHRAMIIKMMADLEEHPAMASYCCGPHQSFHTELFRYGRHLARLRRRTIADAELHAACAMLAGALFTDSLTRDWMPDTFPRPSGRAPARYAALFLQALGLSAGHATTRSSRRPSRTHRVAMKTVVFLSVLVGAATLSAQPNAGGPLSLADALRRAEAQSEALVIAQAGQMRAEGQLLQARSLYLPEVTGSASYSRTLKSQFSVFQQKPVTPPAGTPPAPPNDGTTYYSPCSRYLAGSGASDADRLRGLETAARCVANAGGGIDFSKAGFGSKNQYNLGLTGQWILYSGGRVQATTRAAEAGKRSADIEVRAQRAQVMLTVTEAYFDAALADRLVVIAESALVQTDGALAQTKLARQVGNQSEFDLLRAQVTRDNQLPVVLQRRTDRDLAYLRLKQLLNIPLGESLSLTTPIGDSETLATVTQVAMRGVEGTAAPDTSAENRATVRQLTEAVHAAEAQQRAVRAARLPSIALSSQFGRVAFPSSGAPGWNDFLTNWSVSLGASFPIFTGGRTKGEILAARAGAMEARARLDQTRELASLEARQSVFQLQQAEAAMEASRGTSEQAQKAYTIAEVRYREGISTQLELSESRILLEQAQANRAVAARNLQLARTRLLLLRDLPLGAGTGGAFNTGGAALVVPVAPTGSGAGAPGGTGGSRAGPTAAASVGQPQP